MDDDRLVPVIAELRKRRLGLGLSGREVSRRVGKHESWVSAIESGQTDNPTIATLVLYAGELQMEFGIYTAVDGHFAEHPLVGEEPQSDEEEEEQNEEKES